MLRTFSLSSAALGDEPPREFLIFRRGINTTTTGSVLFDDVAAESVLSAWRRWGVDLIIDLEHASVLGENPATDRVDARDARGYFDLELRNGELWAVNVRWTAEGERRIRERTQRYISPAFIPDEKTGRVVELINCALCSMPATHHAQELIAASYAAQNKLAAAARAAQYQAQARKK